MKKKSKIFLTGGSGFIGRNIKESFLSDKYTIIAPSIEEVDILDEEKVNSFFKKNEVDFVIHSAIKPTHRNAVDTKDVFYINTKMFFNLEKNNRYYKKMLFIGSGSAYDVRNYKSKMKEEDLGINIPVDDLGFYKYICSKNIENSKNIIDLRIFGIFGKYEDYAIRFISNLICKSIFDLPLSMNQNRNFDYLYIDDLMPIIDFFLENEVSYNAYNITPNETLELIDIACKIKKISGKDLPLKIREEGMGLEYSGDNSRLKNEFKELSFTPIDKSIKDLYDWYLLNQKTINYDLLKTDK